MILITGCAGFIGSNACHFFCQKERVVGIDILTAQSNREWITDLEKNDSLIFQRIDVRDGDALSWLFRAYNITDVIHLAAETHVDRSFAAARDFWSTNVMGTFELMRAASKAKVRKFINQITDECYGEKPEGSAVEGDVFYPTGPYPCSKVAQYFVGQSFANAHNLPLVSTFPVNCFGPRQNIEKLIPRFLHHLIVLQQPVPLMASTHFERDWLPVEDLCHAFEILLQKGQGDYNVGANNHRSNLKLTHEILDLCGLFPHDDWIEIVPDRKTHDCRYAVDSSRLRALGWEPKHRFNDYLATTIGWYDKFFGETHAD